MGLRGALRRSGICVVPGGVNIEGVLTADNVIGSQGKTIYMDPTQSSGFTGRTPGTACKTIHEGYAKLTADQNDTLVYLVGATSATVTDTLEWAKDYTHFFGKGVVLRNQSRARIFNSGNTTGSYNLFKVSAKGCAFSNLRFFQGSAIATAFGVEVSGDWNSFDYCTFQGMGNATPAGNATNYSLKLTGADMCEFRNCTIGGSSTLRTADNAQLTFASYASQLLFKDCWILSYAQTNTYPIVRFAANNSGANLIEFEDCTFYNRWAGRGTKLLEVFELADPTGDDQLDILLSGKTCHIGCTEWATGDRGNIWVVSGGTAVVGAAGVATTGTPVEPT